MPTNLEARYAQAMSAMAGEPNLWRYVYHSQKIPAVHRGTGPIRLVVLGQDPTVKNEASRQKILHVLNLKGSGALHNYLQRICLDLQLDLKQNVYATNYVKNFFTSPPTQIKELDVLALASKHWLPLLLDELADFPNVPVITLGQPLLERIVTKGASPLVRDYWDYQPRWERNAKRKWAYLPSEQNVLNRMIFPFPHQPSLRKSFYRQHLPYYLQFVHKRMHSPK
jgi:hypothetical protein